MNFMKCNIGETKSYVVINNMLNNIMFNNQY